MSLLKLAVNNTCAVGLGELPVPVYSVFPCVTNILLKIDRLVSGGKGEHSERDNPYTYIETKETRGSL